MAIFGIGTDMVDITRVAGVMQRTGGRFAEKVLGPEELEVYRRRAAHSAPRGLAFVATRFAAKEAFSKAIGSGMHWPMTWRVMQTLNEASGRPCIVTAGTLRAWCDERRLRVSVTLSDEREYALAFVIVETDKA